MLIRNRSVLIIDRSEETREVLTTALERRGVRALSASRPGEGLQLARRFDPDLVVLDLELDGTGEASISDSLAEPSRAGRPSLVLLGNCRRGGGALPEGEFVRKPYHYGPLIRRIEELLGKVERAVA